MNGADFETWWHQYPRKVCKAEARRAWARMTEEQKFAATAALPVHVRYWDMSGRTKEYVPHAATWLRGERWEDELEMPQPKKAIEAWWASKEGIERKARELGMWPPRMGEDWHSLKARILAKEKAA